MLGLMQDRPLALPHVFHRAEQYFGHKTIVTAEAGRETSTTVAE
jgi:fatty-acyl-CoA synthase